MRLGTCIATDATALTARGDVTAAAPVAHGDVAPVDVADGRRERFLRAFAAEVERERLRWCVLRGHDSFPRLVPAATSTCRPSGRNAEPRGEPRALARARARRRRGSTASRASSSSSSSTRTKGPDATPSSGSTCTVGRRASACRGWTRARALARTELVRGLRRPAPGVLAASANALGALLSSRTTPSATPRSCAPRLLARDRAAVERELAQADSRPRLAHAIADAAEPGPVERAL